MIHPAQSASLRLSMAGLGLALMLGGCSDDNNGNTPDVVVKDQMVVVATTASDYSSGAYAVFSASEPFSGTDNLNPDHSNLTVTCHGDHLYRIENNGNDNVTRFAFNAPATVLSQFSTNASDGTDIFNGNPHDLVFASETKAYLMRYGSTKAWIVNPSATTAEDFKIGELDLSAYTVDGNTVPNMETALIVDGYLLIAMQRFDVNWNPQTAYVAVFDTVTDTEIDLNPGVDGLNGIELPVTNPVDLEYNASTGLVYVLGTGRQFNPDYEGGIASIDVANNFATAMVLDDGDSETHPFGIVTHMEIISDSVAYISGSASWQNDGLYRFDPSTGAFDSDAEGNPLAVANLSGVAIGGLAQDNQQRLWVSQNDSTQAGLKLINTSSNEALDTVLTTTLNPGRIAICDQSAE